jgi:hypothetical protein
MKTMSRVVKVMKSVFEERQPPSVMVYDKDRTILYLAPLDDLICSLLGNRSKAYFFADLVPDKAKKGCYLVQLKTEAPPQYW